MKASYRTIEETNLSKEKYGSILCPTLRIGVRMGLLNPDADGWVREEELSAYLAYIGVEKGSGIHKGLISTGELAPREKRKKYVNIAGFKGTFLDHGSSSGILNNSKGFSQKRLEHLKSFSSDGKCLYQKNLAAAASDFYKNPANKRSLLGTNIQSLELGTFLSIFGRKSNDGESVFSMQDVDDVWKHNKFPETWKKPSVQSGTLSGLRDYFSMTFARLFRK